MKKNSIADSIAAEMERNKRIENKVFLSSKEQFCGRALTEMGKQAFFVEYYYNIKPIDQDYTSIEGYKSVARSFTKEEVLETIPFKKGYSFAEVMLKSGSIPERYQEDNLKKHR